MKDSILTQLKSAAELPFAAAKAWKAKADAASLAYGVNKKEKVIANRKNPNYFKDLKNIRGYKKGGKVKKTGIAKVHKGERVLTKKQAKKFDAKKYEKVKKKVFNT